VDKRRRSKPGDCDDRTSCRGDTSALASSAPPACLDGRGRRAMVRSFARGHYPVDAIMGAVHNNLVTRFRQQSFFFKKKANLTLNNKGSKVDRPGCPATQRYCSVEARLVRSTMSLGSLPSGLKRLYICMRGMHACRRKFPRIS